MILLRTDRWYRQCGRMKTCFPAKVSAASDEERREKIMLETVAVVLIVLWILGMVSSTTMGGLIHVLLAVAVAVILIRVIRGRRVV